MKTKFIIWFSQRSGSTHLGSLLDCHSRIAYFPEIFFFGEGGIQLDYFLKSGVSDEILFLDHFFSYNWGLTGANLPHGAASKASPLAVGFKLKYSQVITYPRIIEYLSTVRRELKVIHLVRKNLLASLVSAKFIPTLMKQFGKPNITTENSLGGLQRTVYVDQKTVLSELRQLEALIDENTKKVVHFNTLEVVYEELVAKERKVIQQIQEFIQVPVDEHLVSRYQKILPTNLSHTITNVEEIKACLKGTRYEWMLTG